MSLVHSKLTPLRPTFPLSGWVSTDHFAFTPRWILSTYVYSRINSALSERLSVCLKLISVICWNSDKAETRKYFHRNRLHKDVSSSGASGANEAIWKRGSGSKTEGLKEVGEGVQTPPTHPAPTYLHLELPVEVLRTELNQSRKSWWCEDDCGNFYSFVYLPTQCFGFVS